MRAEDYEKVLNDNYAEKLELYYSRKKEGELEEKLESKGGEKRWKN